MLEIRETEEARKEKKKKLGPSVCCLYTLPCLFVFINKDRLK